MSNLAPLHRGFRADYLDYDALTAQLRAWADAHPSHCRLESLGQTPEGRAIWMLTIGAELDRPRPAAWVDGNMHASEVCGSSVALAIAEDVLALHLGESVEGISPQVADVLRAIHLHVVPRISPDGAEAVLKTGRYVRSVPRDVRPNRQHARWIAEDVDGDGLALVMRQVDPAGEYVESKDFPGLLVPRELDDEGPFYKIYPEGRIEGWDGFTIPDPYFLSDNDTDLNRNFPYHWAPEPQQAGAGRYAGSEPETRAIVEAAIARPNLFAWLNLHTFGGVLIRPLGAAPDSKMHPSDLALFRQLEAWAIELTGYPTVSGFHQFLYEPEKPLHGDLSDFAYHQRGAFAWVCELWDLFDQAGLPKRDRFVDRYSHLDREHVVQLAVWDRDHNDGAVIRPWKKHVHPQLGEVEVGGLDPRFGFWNPPRARLAEVCRSQSALFARVAALAPRVVIAEPKITRLSEGVHRVELEVSNHGYLATCGIESARALPWNEPLHVELVTNGTLEVDDADRRRAIGHLEGWGRGRWSGGSALYFQRSRGSVSRARVVAVVRGHGELRVQVTSCRVGTSERVVRIEG